MLLTFAGDLPPSSSILALGGEDAYYVNHFRRRGHRVTTVTVPPGDFSSGSPALPRPSPVEQFIRTLAADTPSAPHGYDLILLHRVLHLVDPELLEELPRHLNTQGWLYVKTFAADDVMCLEHRFVPVASIEYTFRPLVKLDERRYWENVPHPRRGLSRHHSIELLFQKLPPPP